jgi:hypothetical protein
MATGYIIIRHAVMHGLPEMQPWIQSLQCVQTIEDISYTSELPDLTYDDEQQS